MLQSRGERDYIRLFEMTKKNVLEKVVFGWGGEVVFGVRLRVWVKFFIKLKWRSDGGKNIPHGRSG